MTAGSAFLALVPGSVVGLAMGKRVVVVDVTDAAVGGIVMGRRRDNGRWVRFCLTTGGGPGPGMTFKDVVAPNKDVRWEVTG